MSKIPLEEFIMYCTMKLSGIDHPHPLDARMEEVFKRLDVARELDGSTEEKSGPLFTLTLIEGILDIVDIEGEPEHAT
jgi:hypothetical protein